MLDLPRECTSEMQLVKVVSYGTTVFILNVYRPICNDVGSIDSLRIALPFITSTMKNSDVLFVVGDFNTPDSTWNGDCFESSSNNSKTTELLDLFDDSLMEQIVHFPTRNRNFLDLVFTTHPGIIIDSVSTPPISDHLGVLTTVFIPVQRKEASRDVKVWSDVDINSIRHEFTDFYFSFCNNNPAPVPETWTAFKDKCRHCIDRFVPTKSFSAHKRVLPRKVLVVIRQKKRAYHTAAQYPTQANKEKLRMLRNRCVNLLKSLDKLELSKICSSTEDGIRRPFWNHIKRTRTDAPFIPHLLLTDRVTHSVKPTKSRNPCYGLPQRFCFRARLWSTPTTTSLPHYARHFLYSN
jgi:hypothetical protein